MKQRNELGEETDSLLHACWSLAEMLFSIRQSRRDGNAPDAELLGSAVQACWELCDIFREGWSQVRPSDRTTPRPTQTSFPPSLKSHSSRPESSLSSSSYHDAPSLPPETPTTIFDDATTDGESDVEDPAIPEILVLGTRGTSHLDRWSSNASTLSDYSETSSQRTSSTARAKVTENAHLVALRLLIIKAAIEVGFTRGGNKTLAVFAREVRKEGFGWEEWQLRTCHHWKKLCCVDKSLGQAAAVAPTKVARVTAKEVSEAVVWLAGSEEWRWLAELFRWVFGFGVDEVGSKGSSVVLQL